MINILASTSEFERELIQARMTEGRKRAGANGVKFGPKFKLNPFQRQEALARQARARAPWPGPTTWMQRPSPVCRGQCDGAAIGSACAALLVP